MAWFHQRWIGHIPVSASMSKRVCIRPIGGEEQLILREWGVNEGIVVGLRYANPTYALGVAVLDKQQFLELLESA